MATIKQTESQIANVHKRIANHESKIVMYEGRLEKALAKINAAVPGLGVTRDNFKEIERAEYAVSNYDHYKFFSSIDNAVDGIEDHEKAIRFERRDLDRLEKILAELKANEDAAAAKYNANLEMALRDAMKEFRQVWIERMIEWFGRHYDFIMDHVEDARIRNKRINRITTKYYWKLRRYHVVLLNRLNNAAKATGEIISDDANRYKGDRDRYLADKREMLIKQFEDNIVKLTTKCQEYNLDDTKIQVHNPGVTEKGFQVMITDDTDRLIFARIIWAAEYSDLVSPHTRYIVTSKERRIDK